MENKTKNRDWVKNAAIIFLSVLLVLTFFSNTWMNRSLPEVATQYVTSGSITAKVRGTGTVSAVGLHTVKADQTREIRAVMVKSGQKVEPGDVLFVLGQGEASALEQAQENLRQLQISYQRSAINVPTVDYSLQERRIADQEAAVEEARLAMEEAAKKSSKSDLPIKQLEAANAEVAADTAVLKEAENTVAAEQVVYDTYKKAYDDLYNQTKETWDITIVDNQATLDSAVEASTAAEAEAERLHIAYEALKAKYESQQESGVPEGEEEVTQEMLDQAQQEWNAAIVAKDQAKQAEEKAQADLDKAIQGEKDALDALDDTSVKAHEAKLNQAKAAVEEAKENLRIATEKRDAIQATVDEILDQDGVSEEYTAAKKAYQSAKDYLFELQYNLQQEKINDSKSQQLSYLDLSDIGAQIENAKKKVLDLSGGEENQITAKVAGTVQTVECAPGDTKLKDDVLCTIEVPDMGYTLSFTVTNDQARRLKVGDTATVSNYYWGNEIVATLNNIKTDPKNPQNNKILTFDLEGDVNAGAELTLSVGQKSANYDNIVPNSAVRSDTNGKFVLVVESKNSPLGNRYYARRVAVEVLTEDDMNSAVTGDLGYGSYVITTSNAPIKNGDMVRLADNG